MRSCVFFVLLSFFSITVARSWSTGDEEPGEAVVSHHNYLGESHRETGNSNILKSFFDSFDTGLDSLVQPEETVAHPNYPATNVPFYNSLIHVTENFKNFDQELENFEAQFGNDTPNYRKEKKLPSKTERKSLSLAQISLLKRPTKVLKFTKENTGTQQKPTPFTAFKLPHTSTSKSPTPTTTTKSSEESKQITSESPSHSTVHTTVSDYEEVTSKTPGDQLSLHGNEVPYEASLRRYSKSP